MDFAAYKFEMHDGLPPEGEPGQFFGFDKDSRAYVLRWISNHPSDPSRWIGVGFGGPYTDGKMAPVVVSNANADDGPSEPIIVKWATAPWSGPIT